MLVDCTIPPGSRTTRNAELVRDGKSARTAWAFADDMDWEAYSAWVGKNLEPVYTRRDADRVPLRFQRTTEGDMYIVVIERIDSGLETRINFIGQPF